MSSGLSHYTNYRNPYFSSLTNVQIIEYDMKDAGLNLTKYYKLLPESDIRYLESLTKAERIIKMGKIQRDNKVYRRALMQAFRDGRELFFEANDLNEDNVLAIKKDAIFTIKTCAYSEFDNIVFAEKNKYSSYYLFDKYEFYYFEDGIDVKGISDENVMKHSGYMLTSLHDFMFMMENSSRERTIRYVKDFLAYYKSKELAIEFYRELNSDSMFRLIRKFSDKSIGIDQIQDKSMIDIHYNFNKYLVKLVEILV